MRIQRYFTTKKSGAFGKTDFQETSSEIRNPDGSLVFKHDAIEVPTSWSQVACDVLAQKYFRKAGIPVKVKKVEESDVPTWLWRSVPDIDSLKDLAEHDRYVGKHRQNKYLTGWQVVGPIGAERRLFRLRSRRSRLL